MKYASNSSLGFNSSKENSLQNTPYIEKRIKIEVELNQNNKEEEKNNNNKEEEKEVEKIVEKKKIIIIIIKMRKKKKKKLKLMRKLKAKIKKTM